ncbi:V-containing nitrogenase subunit delta, partial [Nostoc sp. NOS(2021)]|uniref:V-containing nitrogenase subunit delta n=1 Tax=Nostoc sp. NOS(2021) TaxID=2815407 RepID=UPI0025CC4143
FEGAVNMARDMYNAIYSPLMKLAKDDIRGEQKLPSTNGNGNGKATKELSEEVVSLIQQQVKEATSQVKQQVKETASQVKQLVKEAAPQVQPQAKEVAPQVQPQAKEVAPQVQPQAKEVAPQVQLQAKEIASYIQERAGEVTKLIQERCLWQFHSRAWDREENINGVLNMAAQILTGEKVVLETLIQRGFYADAKILSADLEIRFSWLNSMENSQKKAVLESVKAMLIDIVITKSKNGELHYSLY